MASTNFTTHYSIPLPLGTDLTTPMDYNEAAEEIDTALFGAVTDANNASQAANEAVQTANTASTTAESVGADLALEKAKIVQLQTRMTAAENNIDDVYTDVTDMITAYKEPSATSTHAYAIGDYFIYNETLYKATATIAIGATIVPNTNCETTNVSSELIQVNSDINNLNKVYSVSTDGVKTYTQLLSELSALVGNADIHPKSCIELDGGQILHCRSINFPSSVEFNRISVPAADAIDFYSLNLRTGSYTQQHLANGGTITRNDFGSNIPTTGRTIKFFC